MPSSPVLYDRLLEELPKHRYIKDAMIAAGFAESTALKSAKKTLEAAVRHYANRVIMHSQAPSVTRGTLMTDLVGINRIEVFSLLKKIANQDKDYGSALKVLAPLAKEHGVILADDEGPKKAPSVINVIVEKNVPEPVTATSVNSDLDNETNVESN